MMCKVNALVAVEHEREKEELVWLLFTLRPLFEIPRQKREKKNSGWVRGERGVQLQVPRNHGELKNNRRGCL